MRPMVKRDDVPVLLTVAALGLGVGIGLMLMKERNGADPQRRRLRDPLDMFDADLPDDAFEGVTNFPHMPEGWRPRRRLRD